MNAHTPPTAPTTMVGDTPSAASDKPFNPARAARAFRCVADMENDFNRIRNMVRMLFIMDLNDICHDNRDVHALLELGYIADDALDRIGAARQAACSELHPFAYPRRHGWPESVQGGV